MSILMLPLLLSPALPDTPRTMTPGFCWGLLRGWRTREQPTSCPVNLGIPGSGTAVISKQQHVLVCLIFASLPNYLFISQPLPQHGRVQPVRAAGRRHPEAGGRGPQGQFLSGGHFLWLGILPPIRLHVTHSGVQTQTCIIHPGSLLTKVSGHRGWVLVAMTPTTLTSTVSGSTSLTSPLGNTSSRSGNFRIL